MTGEILTKSKIIKLRVTPELLGLFARYRLQTAQRSQVRWKIGDVVTVNSDARIEPYTHILHGSALPATMGAFSYVCSAIEPTMRIGRYSSLAAFVSQLGMGHPTDWASTSPFSHNPQPMGGFAAYLNDIGVEKFHVHSFDQQNGPVEIGNDVWIGENALIKPGITIGDGAIVAARAIVTHHVPPYAIVGGTPARLIRYRFNEDVIARMRGAQWWRHGPEMLQPLDVRDPIAFLDRFEAAVASGVNSLDLPILTGQEIIAAGEVAT